MSDQPPIQLGVELAKLRSQSEKRPNASDMTLYFSWLIAPAILTGIWQISGEIKTVLNVGVWIFCVACIVLAIGGARFFSHFEKLKNVRQEYLCDVPGLFGPVKKGYMTDYDFGRFTLADVEIYKKMRFWGYLFLWATGTTLAWFVTIKFFRAFVWL
jgi:hypothetical protein